jgi:hypothetical protein
MQTESNTRNYMEIEIKNIYKNQLIQDPTIVHLNYIRVSHFYLITPFFIYF